MKNRLAMYCIFISCICNHWTEVYPNPASDEATYLPSLQSKHKPPIGKKAADTYINATQQYEKNIFIGMYLSSFISSSSTENNSLFSSQEDGFSFGLTYLHKLLSSPHLFMRGHLLLDRFQNKDFTVSFLPSFLWSWYPIPIYIGIGVPGLEFLSHKSQNQNFAINWQILAGIHFLKMTSFLNVFLEMRWKNPFDILSPPTSSLYLFVGISFLF